MSQQVELAIELEWPELNHRLLEAAREREASRKKQEEADQRIMEAGQEGSKVEGEGEGEIEGEGRGEASAAALIGSASVSMKAAKDSLRISALRPTDPSSAEDGSQPLDLPAGKQRPVDPHPVESSEPGRYLQHLWVTGFVRSRAKVRVMRWLPCELR